jgi:hypothetical protein
MDEEEERQAEETTRRPRVVDKRISARTGGQQVEEGSSPPREPAPRSQGSPPAPATSAPSAPEPSGTVPESSSATPPGAVRGEQVWTPEQEAEAARMAQEIAETPSFEWVVNTAVTLANVAATKLELGAGADAQLAIDALAGIVNSVGPRLQQAEGPLRQTLAQLQLAYAQRSMVPPPPPSGTG